MLRKNKDQKKKILPMENSEKPHEVWPFLLFILMDFH